MDQHRMPNTVADLAQHWTAPAVRELPGLGLSVPVRLAAGIAVVSVAFGAALARQRTLTGAGFLVVTSGLALMTGCAAGLVVELRS